MQMVSWGKKFKLRIGEKNEKGDRIKEENYIKKGERGLKNASLRTCMQCRGSVFFLKD